MHFVAMLAFSMPGMEASYDPSLTALSLLLAIGATGIAFAIVNRQQAKLLALLLSGLFMGLGIAGMHYTGMAAMRMHADLSYERFWVATSILIAIGAATTALWLAFGSVRSYSRLIAAVVMGFAVSGMHYAAMQGLVFSTHVGQHTGQGDASLDQIRLALAVAATTFVILFLASVAAMFDRRFAVLVEREATALRASEERFRTLYRMTPLPLHFLDSAGAIQQVSDAWLDLLGYARTEVIGRPLTNFMTEASTRQRIQSDWPKLAEQGFLENVEYRFVTKSGDFRDVVLSSRAERDAQGRLSGVLGGLVDVTARKHAEDALRQAQKIEAVGQLTGGVAHDFNNLLAVVLGNLELMRKRLPDDERSLRLLDNAVQGAKRGAALTQRLLAFARRQDLKPEPVNVATLVHGMADLLQRAIGPEVRIDVQFPLDLPKAQVDANQLELALLNLAVNARDAMPNGGTITIAAREQTDSLVRLNSAHPGGYVCVSVADTGEGMDEATLMRAREPFFTTKGIGKGTGLGLSMVHGLAEQSGGKLLLKSEKDRGTTAEVWLPIATTEVPPSIALHERREPEVLGSTSLGMSILVVDDDALVLSNTAEMLEDLGHTVLRASSGREALALLKGSSGVDLLLTDHAMPEMSGSQLVATVRSERPSMPVILASGYAELAADIPSNLFRLQKPFDQAALRRALDAQITIRDVNVIHFPVRQG
ncbi:Sensor histidine kinase RcsC [Methylobacterium gnaphalii]|nr:Sensor histidine kinase RcsC [Methylobacterium gnaphalii]